jgi:MoCo/4Fe-4S cofactor protein with predicted Tat translocation signal
MSKRIWQHPEVPAGETTVSWRSAGQLENTPEFREWLDREFPQGASEMANEEEVETSRRSFLKLMGASSALAGFGMAACRRPESYIVPYTKAPEWVIPGKATYYASSMPRSTGAVPLVVTTFEGRPTKLAPNSLHPDNGGTDSFAQASVLDLYSPSRSRKAMKSGKPVALADVEAVLAALAADKSAKVGFVLGADVSPTRVRLAKELAAKFSAAKFYQYEALTGEASKALGDGGKLAVDFSKADKILSLDCDFAGVDPQGPVTAFFDRRKPEGKDYEKKADETSMNRLYVVESAYSLTGGMADHRLRVTPSQVLLVAGQIATALGVDLGKGTTAITDGKTLKWITPLVEDLKASKGKALVLAGSRQPAAVHHLALAINLALGSLGEGKPAAIVQSEAQGYGDLVQLKKDIEAGAVETLFLLSPSNPVYDAPADLKFAEALAKVKTSIHLSERVDATAFASTWHIPATHYLESWTDARSSSGVYTVVQPMILPLYPNCISEVELLLALLSDSGKLVHGEGEKGAPSPAYDAVRKTFATLGQEGDAVWKKLLRDGFLKGSSYPLKAQSVSANAAADIASANIEAVKAGDLKKGELQVLFSTDASVFDGRWIDNAWLQEAPDPISKITWDNAALIAPKTAKELGIYDKVIEPEALSEAVPVVVPVEGKFAKVGPDGEASTRRQRMIEVSVNGKTPVGHVDRPQQVHRLAPRASSPARARTTSRSSARIRSAKAASCSGSAWIATSPSARTTSRGINNVAFKSPPIRRTIRRAEQLGKRRDGAPAGGLPAVRSRPCETVCPVNATVHTEDGLNAMAYNRCIGTRYCANNCPYTARRFNWFDYNKRNPLGSETRHHWPTTLHGPLGEKADESLRLQRNPNVTVRMRGVIEKCTYCVQRLEGAKILRSAVSATLVARTSACHTDSVKRSPASSPARPMPSSLATCDKKIRRERRQQGIEAQLPPA